MKPTPWIALLRGMNLGGKSVPMKELATMFEKAGGESVRTFIASGNVVFSASAGKAKAIATTVEKAIEKKHGFHCRVVLRSEAALAKAIKGNPFAKRTKDARQLHVVFFTDKPKLAFDPKDYAPDEVAVKGDVAYLYLPHLLGHSKLATLVTKMPTGTTRNWNTVQKLLELCQALRTTTEPAE